MKKIWMMYTGICIFLATFFVYAILGRTWESVFLDIRFGFLNNEYKIVFALIVFLLVYVCGFLVIHSIFSRLIFEWTIRFYKWKYKLVSGEIIKKCSSWIFVSGLVLSLLCALSIIVDRYDDKNQWNYPLTIAHAGGGIDGYIYSNCKEAVLYNYGKGFRTFEIDFSVTKDQVMVAKHDWNMVVQENIPSGYVPTQEEFLSSPIYEKYTPMSLADLCGLMEEYEDMWLVTDIKDANAEEMEQAVNILVDTVQNLGKEEILDRIVVQVYSEETFDKVEGIYPFRNWIFTLYQCWDGKEENFAEYAQFCNINGIDTIAMWDYCVTPYIIDVADNYGINIYVHTVNDAEMAQKYIDMGVMGIYTDFVMPDKLR